MKKKTKQKRYEGNVCAAKKKGKLHLFLFHDGIEEYLVVATSKADSFLVIEELEGARAADELVLSGLHQYPDAFKLPKGGTAGGTARTIFKGKRGFLHGNPGQFVMPPNVAQCWK